MTSNPRAYAWRGAELVVEGSVLSPTARPPLPLRELPPVRVATAIPVSVWDAPWRIDGIALRPLDRVLLTEQRDARQNGVWIFDAPGQPMRRADDLADGARAEGALVLAVEGNANAFTRFVATSGPGADVVGVDELMFTELFAGLDVAGAAFPLPIEAQVEYVALRLDGMRARSPVSDLPAYRQLLRAATARAERAAWARRVCAGIDAARAHAATERAAIVRWLRATLWERIPFDVPGGACAEPPRPRNARLRVEGVHPTLGRGVVRSLACEGLTGRRCRARSRAPWPPAVCLGRAPRVDVNRTALAVSNGAVDVNICPPG